MRKVSYVILMSVVPLVASAGSVDLDSAIQKTREACSGISDKMGDLKTKAGISTAISAVGTVAGGVALGTGLAKSKVDKAIEELETALNEYGERQEIPEGAAVISTAREPVNQTSVSVTQSSINSDSSNNKLKQMEEKSKTLGNIRTGTLATATATSIASAVVSGTTKINSDFEAQIKECIESVKNLKTAYMTTRIDHSADESQLAVADTIVKTCSQWEDVNLDTINNRGKGATITSGIGAAVGLAGTITSGVANSDKIRNDNTDVGKDKEKSLNTAANVMAGGVAVTSGVSTILSATQISAIKKAVSIADLCEEALR